MNSIVDVAKAAGVSVSTVSRVFSSKAHFKRETRDRILKVARKLDYSPRKWNRQTKTAIAVIIEGRRGTLCRDTYDKEMLVAVSSGLTKHDAFFECIPLSEMDLVRSGAFQGAITILHSEVAPEFFNGLSGRLPIMHVNHAEYGGASVNSDDEQGLFQAMEHLAAYGHRRVGILTRGQPDRLDITQGRRLQGYLQAVKHFGLEADESLVVRHQHQVAQIIEPLAQCLKAKPSAIIDTYGEDTGAPLMHALHLLDKRVPEDLSVITYENPTVAPFLIPPHTTIAQDMERIGELAVQKLMAWIAGKKPDAQRVDVPCRLIKRWSVKNLKGL